MGDLTNIILIGLNSLIILVIILANKNTKSNWLFVYFLLSLIGWKLTLSEYLSSTTNSELLLWGRLNFGVSVLVFLYAFLFTNNFGKIKIINNQIFNKSFILFSFILSFISFATPLVGADEYIVDGVKKTDFGPLYGLFFGYIILTLIGSIVILVLKYRISDAKTSKQLSLIIFGFTVSSAIILTTNIILPFQFGVFTLQELSTLGVIPLTLSIFYSILRYQFLEVRFVFARLAYFILGSIIVITIYYIALEIQITVYGDPQKIETIILAVPISFLFIYIYDIYRHFVQEKISSAIINPGWDPKEISIKFNERASTILEYQEIILHLKNTLSTTVKPTKIVVYTELDNGEKYLDPIEYSSSYTPNIAKLVNWWKEVQYYPIQIDEIELDYPQLLINRKAEVMQILHDMKEQDLQIIFPIFNGERVSGILLLGKREVGKGFYDSINTKFIQGLCATTALALARANLYEEVKNFNESLKQRINEATEEIERKNQQLSESLRIERDMLDILGHELRTPITTVRNILGTIKLFWSQKTLDDKKMNKFLSMAEENIKREVVLLETILASAKIDNEKLDLAKEKIEANDVVNDSVFSYTPFANEKKLDLIVKMPQEKVFCIADRIRIQQVLDNLVSNAIKYTQKGTVTLQLTQDEEWVTFSVIDTGEGIKKEDLKHLGEKFYRVNNYIESEGKLGERQIVRPGGTGIGLYVVFQLVKHMNGEINVESEFGKGSTFSFKVPKFSEERLLNMQSVLEKEKRLKAMEAQKKEKSRPTA